MVHKTIIILITIILCVVDCVNVGEIGWTQFIFYNRYNSIQQIGISEGKGRHASLYFNLNGMIGRWQDWDEDNNNQGWIQVQQWSNIDNNGKKSNTIKVDYKAKLPDNILIEDLNDKDLTVGDLGKTFHNFFKTPFGETNNCVSFALCVLNKLSVLNDRIKEKLRGILHQTPKELFDNNFMLGRLEK
jgi:hypothetical protein